MSDHEVLPWEQFSVFSSICSATFNIIQQLQFYTAYNSTHQLDVHAAEKL